MPDTKQFPGIDAIDSWEREREASVLQELAAEAYENARSLMSGKRICGFEAPDVRRCPACRGKFTVAGHYQQLAAAVSAAARRTMGAE